MGQAISSVLKPGSAVEDKTKEQLEIMMKLADARLDTFEAELTEMFLDNASAAKKSVPGKRALRFERSVSVLKDENPGEGVNSAIDSFFGIGNGADTKTGLLNGFKSVVKTGLSAFLGDSSAGESYEKKFFVCIKHNAVVRLDIYTYRYNFKNSGIVDTHKSVMAYILCTSVVDHTQLTVDELVYLASEFAGDSMEQYEKYLTDLISVWRKLQMQGVTAAMTNVASNLQQVALTNQLALPPVTGVIA